MSNKTTIKNILKDMVNNVDGVIIARDDWQSHKKISQYLS